MDDECLTAKCEEFNTWVIIVSANFVMRSLRRCAVEDLMQCSTENNNIIHFAEDTTRT